MKMTPIVSSDLSSVGYENNTLYILFNSGDLYSYDNVPESIYVGLMSASSHGKYFHMYIKNSYPYHKMS